MSSYKLSVFAIPRKKQSNDKYFINKNGHAKRRHVLQVVVLTAFPVNFEQGVIHNSHNQQIYQGQLLQNVISHKNNPRHHTI